MSRDDFSQQMIDIIKRLIEDFTRIGYEEHSDCFFNSLLVCLTGCIMTTADPKLSANMCCDMIHKVVDHHLEKRCQKS